VEFAKLWMELSKDISARRLSLGERLRLRCTFCVMYFAMAVFLCGLVYAVQVCLHIPKGDEYIAFAITLPIWYLVLFGILRCFAKSAPSKGGHSSRE
jgi:hypothetical protein